MFYKPAFSEIEKILPPPRTCLFLNILLNVSTSLKSSEEVEIEVLERKTGMKFNCAIFLWPCAKISPCLTLAQKVWLFYSALFLLVSFYILSPLSWLTKAAFRLWDNPSVDCDVLQSWGTEAKPCSSRLARLERITRVDLSLRLLNSSINIDSTLRADSLKEPFQRTGEISDIDSRAPPAAFNSEI